MKELRASKSSKEGARDALPDGILSCALTLFRAQGFERTSLREIAEQLGVTKAAIYYHFPAKVDLLETLVRPVQERLGCVLDRKPATTMPEREGLIADYLDTLLDHREIISWLANDAAALSQVTVGATAEMQMNDLRRLLAGRSRRTVDLVATECAIGALHGGAFALLDRKADTSRRAIIDAATAAFEAVINADGRP